MFKTIKTKLKSIVDLRVNSIIENQRLLQQTNFIYNHISQLFNDSHFIPYSVWTISPSLILHVLNEIVIKKRKAVIEFGGGASTFYITKLIKTNKLETKFYTVESNEDWGSELQTQLKALELDNIVKVIYAPLVNVPGQFSFQGQKSWYDTTVLNENIDKATFFDVILVDGPAGKNTRFSRYSAVPFLKDRINSEFSIFLDDTIRKDERIIAEEWQKMLNCKSIKTNRYTNLTNVTDLETLPFQFT